MNNKKHFVLRLIPPRPTFAMDMNHSERAVMEQHVAYWGDLMNKGIALVYGPVFDADGAYGLGIVEVTDETEAQQLAANDPANGLNRFVIAPMRAVLPNKR